MENSNKYSWQEAMEKLDAISAGIKRTAEILNNDINKINEMINQGGTIIWWLKTKCKKW